MLKHLHKLSKGNVDYAILIMDRLDDRLVHSGIDVSSSACKEKIMIGNLRRFLHLPQFKSRGKRKMQLQQTILTAWTSVFSPSYGYYNIPPFGECAIINKHGDVYTAQLAFGILYCHESQLQKYEQTGQALHHRKIAQYMFGSNKRNPTLSQICQDLRNCVEAGGNPFETIKKPMKRWNNFDDEIDDAVHAFCHDPEYIRPDNYSKQTYCCKDDLGKACKHQRHNWMISGDINFQHLCIAIWAEVVYLATLLGQAGNTASCCFLNPTNPATQ